MKFANNTEAWAFDKSGWAITEISADGNTIYQGKPKTENATVTDPVWFVKKTVKKESNGGQIIETKEAVGSGKVAWSDRARLTYIW